MDDLDRRLIATLRVNGRASLSELAKSLGVCRGTVQNRLTRLMDADVITGFTVRLKSSATAHKMRAISMIEVAGANTRQVARALRGLQQIREVYSTNGAFDLVAEIEVDNIEEFDRLLSALRLIDGVARSETTLLLASA